MQALVLLEKRCRVRLSVCPSVTLWYCIKTNKASVMISSATESPKTLVFSRLSRNSKGSPRATALNVTGVGTNWRFLTFKPQYLRNCAKWDQGCYWSLIGSRIRAFIWFRNQQPRLTLNWPWMAMHSCISETTTKIWMKTEPYRLLSGAKV